MSDNLIGFIFVMALQVVIVCIDIYRYFFSADKRWSRFKEFFPRYSMTASLLLVDLLIGGFIGDVMLVAYMIG